MLTSNICVLIPYKEFFAEYHTIYGVVLLLPYTWSGIM